MAVREALVTVTWNCNGLFNKILELREFVNEHNPHIILLQETHFRPGMNPKIPNYNMIRTDHTNAAGTRAIRGTAIYVKNHLNYINITTPIQNCVDATGISLLIPGEPQLIFFSVYLPPKGNASDILVDLQRLLALDVNVILSGDFNAHHSLWNCSHVNDHGKMIYDFLCTQSAPDHPPTPTHFTNRSSSTIDFSSYHGFNYPKEMSSLQELSSDHNPLFTSFQLSPPPPRLGK